MKTCPQCSAPIPEDATGCPACGAPAAPPPATFGDLVLLETFADEPQALLALTHLQSCDIEASLITDDCGGMIPTLQSGKGYRIFVPPASVATAHDLLSTLPESE